MDRTKLLQRDPGSRVGRPDPADDYELWLRLKPFIGHCLTMNHDLNNPLTAVLGYAELMLESDPPLPEDHVEHLKAIIASAERVRALVDSLCQEKIELSEQIDLKPVIDAYQKIAEPLE